MEQLLRQAISSFVISPSCFASGGPGGSGLVLPISSEKISFAFVKDAIVPPKISTLLPCGIFFGEAGSSSTSKKEVLLALAPLSFFL
jgi:hypothetical protein